jgi:hypothetical protein
MDTQLHAVIMRNAADDAVWTFGIKVALYTHGGPRANSTPGMVSTRT